LRFHRPLVILVCLCLFTPVTSSLAGRRAPDQQQEKPDGPPSYRITRATSPIKIDGVIDEPAWQHALRMTLDYEVQPGENIPPPVKTVCLITYDSTHLYVAFHAFDPHPEQIRAHITDRDKPYRDDFVGVMLDTFNDQRRGYEFFVNPVGVQMDLTRNEVGSGDVEDDSWDAIWKSAARITAKGYDVEFAIPLSSIRFADSSGEQTWRIAPFRAYPRTVRHQIFSVPLDRSDNCFMCQMPKVTGFEGIKAGRDLELDPTLTARRTDALEDEDDLSSPFKNGKLDTQAGVSARWGVTPNISLNAVINPDFSQVEADAAQLDVNTRFALFYPEKRPFFMEGADYFQTPFRAVYTRAVADPAWGLKITGKPGRQAIGVFAARDRVTNLIFPSNQGSDFASLDQDVNVGVFRYRRDLGKSSTVGVLATGRDGGDYSNRVFGIDGLLRFTATDSVNFQLLGSRTRYPSDLADEYDQPHGDFSGSALHVLYIHDDRNWSWWAGRETLSQGFRADLGFIPRVDTKKNVAGVQHNFWGTKDTWYTRITVAAEASQIKDHTGTVTDEVNDFYLRFDGPLQSWLNLDLYQGKEWYDGVTYDKIWGHMFFNIRPTGDFTCSLEGEYGDAIDYTNSRPATITSLEPGMTYDLRHFGLEAYHRYEVLDVPGGRLYRANLTQLRMVYQFNVRMFVRAIIHHLDLVRNTGLYVDEVAPRTRSFFTQLLFSYKLNPQTVFFLGYSDNRLGEYGIDLTRTNRTLFIKLGYAWLG